jgi:hypothetical protein
MKFTSFTTVIITAAAMAGVVIASANEPTANGPNVVPCHTPGEHTFAAYVPTLDHILMAIYRYSGLLTRRGWLQQWQ